MEKYTERALSLRVNLTLAVMMCVHKQATARQKTAKNDQKTKTSFRYDFLSWTISYQIVHRKNLFLKSFEPIFILKNLHSWINISSQKVLCCYRMFVGQHKKPKALIQKYSRETKRNPNPQKEEPSQAAFICFFHRNFRPISPQKQIVEMLAVARLPRWVPVDCGFSFMLIYGAVSSSTPLEALHSVRVQGEIRCWWLVGGFKIQCGW